ERLDGFPQCAAGRAERRIVARLDLGNGLPKLGEISAYRRAAGLRQLAGHEVDRLNAVGAFVDLRNAGVAIVLGGAGLLDVAHAAVDLDAERGNLAADVGCERLGDRREQRRALVRRLADGVVFGAVRAVERDRGRIADRARRV